MLQKLENAYLAILRFFVIFAAGMSLIAVILFCGMALKGYFAEPKYLAVNPVVSENDLINIFTYKNEDKQKPEYAQSQTQYQNKEEAIEKDPNDVFYDKIATSVQNYANATRGVDEINIDSETVKNIAKKRAEKFDEYDLTSHYAENFSIAIDKTLSNPGVIESGKKGDPIKIINGVFNSFESKYESEIQRIKRINIARENEVRNEKNSILTNLYIAGGTFCSFLIIVFFSIIIKIERNLRDIKCQ
jgi:transcription antitermination factor NusG